MSELPSPKAKFSGKPHISGTRGGHTINLHQFARDGVTLLGRLTGVRDGIVTLARDLHDNLAAADRAEAEFVKTVDAYVTATGMTASDETLPALRDGFAQAILTELDLKVAGIANVIWATGYAFDFSMVKLPVVDSDGFPIQIRGVSACDGLFFVGLPWLHTAKSGLIYGVAEDASYIADRIVRRPDLRGDTAARTDATRRIPKATLSLARAGVLAAAFALSTSSASGTEVINPPAAPHVGLVTTPASELSLGMRAQDMTRIMGKASKEKDFVTDAIESRTLEFSGVIPSKVILTDGKVTRVTLDAFRADKDDLPVFSHKAWLGMASSAVRHMLGEPTNVLHHTFFGINVDQLVFARAGEAEVSVFLRADRVIAKALGRDVPANLFRVDLPSPPLAQGGAPMTTPHVGLRASDIEELYGAAKFRVDYVFNGQSASRVVFETGRSGPYAGVTFVDGVVTEFEDLGPMPDDASFQGR